jgi:uncharacterized protein YecE (DUF72 family)
LVQLTLCHTIQIIFNSEEELKSFLPSISMIASKTQKVLIFFNNCHGGSAAKNALMMTIITQRKQLNP